MSLCFQSIEEMNLSYIFVSVRVKPHLGIQMNLTAAERAKGDSDQYIIYLQKQIERFGAYIASQRDQQIEFQNTRSLIAIQANQIKQLNKDIAQMQREVKCTCESSNIEARLKVVEDSIIQNSQYSRNGNQIYPAFDSQMDEREAIRRRLQTIEEKLVDRKSMMREKNEMSQESKIGAKDLVKLEQKICGYFGGKIETLEKMLNKQTRSRSISPIPSDHSSRLTDMSSNNRVKREGVQADLLDSFKQTKVGMTKRRKLSGTRRGKENQSSRRNAIQINQFSTVHRSDAEGGNRISKGKRTTPTHPKSRCNVPSHSFQTNFDEPTRGKNKLH